MTRRPNILVILSDDLGPWAMGCAGNGEILTPTIDRLAAEGTRFDQFYCVSPVSSPTCATLLTGQIPSQHGVHDWLADECAATDDGPALRLLDGRPSYPQVLAANGYTCGLSGEWLPGLSRPLPPHGPGHRSTPGSDGGPSLRAMMGDDVSLTEAITDDALAFIEAHYDKAAPFYLNVHYSVAHALRNESHLRPYLDLYAECAFDSIPRETAHAWCVADPAPEPGSDLWRTELQRYLAAVTAMDASIGRILDRLEVLGLSDDTIVWFVGTHGYSTGHHGVWGRGNATFPLNMWDTSVRVPAIARYPAGIPAGVVRTEMVSAYDFPHTVLDLVGLRLPNREMLPGRSFVDLLSMEGGTNRDRLEVLGEYGPVRMIRTPAWKYIHRFPYGPHELYDVSHDPHERHNLIDDPTRTEIATVLRAEMQRWFVRYVDPAVDGVHEPVTGCGQVRRAGTGNEGREAYRQRQRVERDLAPSH